MAQSSQDSLEDLLVLSLSALRDQLALGSKLLKPALLRGGHILLVQATRVRDMSLLRDVDTVH